MSMQLFIRSAEIKLMQMLNEVRMNPSGWVGLHFHLSGLLEDYKSDYQIKIAINLINDLLKNYEGGIFLLMDHSIIVVCYQLDKSIQEKLIFQLRYLYMDDPLAYTDVGQENPGFCTSYDLKRSWREFSDLCTKRMAVFTRKLPEERPDEKLQLPGEPRLPVIELPKRQPMFSAAEAEKNPVSKVSDKTFSASKLALIERDLNHADLHKVIRRQPICAVLPDMKVRRVFDELYIHIAHLRQILKTDVDFLSNRWLFKYITHILDIRMIDMIRQNPLRWLDSPISINLNVETLLSSWFAEFDASIKPSARVSIIIEIPVVDVFADMAAFTLARMGIQKLGYRICLDGLTTASLASINREKLGFDLVKLQWNADMESDLSSKENTALMEAIQATGSNRVILCRCDNRHAIEYGQALGISLFQGRFLDGVLNPTAKMEN